MFKLFKRKKKDQVQKIADREYKIYKKWLNNHAPTYASGKIDLMRVYTGRNGTNWYLPKDMLQLTNERNEKIAEYQEALGYGMTKEEMIAILEGCIDLNRKQAYAFGSKNQQGHERLNKKLQTDLADTVVRMQTINSSDTMLRIALLYFFIDGEDPYIINSETQKRKYKAAQEDDALRAFFLRTTQILLKELEANE